jgi:hypothetical protein
MICSILLEVRILIQMEDKLSETEYKKNKTQKIDFLPLIIDVLFHSKQKYAYTRLHMK